MVKEVIEKNYPNEFRGSTALLEQLKVVRIEKLIICGAMSHMCIDASNASGMLISVFRCTVVEDGCATRDLSFKGRTIKSDERFMPALHVRVIGVRYAKVLAYY